MDAARDGGGEPADRRRCARSQSLERKNADLESFSYSVSHDLRAPLRAIEDLLTLARASVVAVNREHIDVGTMAKAVVAQLRERDPDRSVTVDVAPSPPARGDTGLIRTVLENLVGNAWRHRPAPDHGRSGRPRHTLS